MYPNSPTIVFPKYCEELATYQMKQSCILEWQHCMLPLHHDVLQKSSRAALSHLHESKKFIIIYPCLIVLVVHAAKYFSSLKCHQPGWAIIETKTIHV